MSSGGTALSVTLSAGGAEAVLAGGTGLGLDLSSGGVINLSSGALQSGSTVESGATYSVTSGATAIDILITSAVKGVSFAGFASDVTILASDSMLANVHVFSGGTLDGFTVGSSGDSAPVDVTVAPGATIESGTIYPSTSGPKRNLT